MVTSDRRDRLNALVISATPIIGGGSRAAASRSAHWLTPRDLLFAPARTLAAMADGIPFHDPHAGVLISRAGLAPESDHAVCGGGVAFRCMAPDSPAGIDRQGVAGAPWFLSACMGDWPAWRGRDQTVAILDSGVAGEHPAFKGVPIEFMSIEAPESRPNDFGTHGTKCCGVIAAQDRNGRRRGVAPAARLVVGQHTRARDSGYVTAVEYVLLCAWAVEAGARVISFSFAASENQVREFGDPAVFSVMAANLRRTDSALLFCAGGNVPGELMYPARARGVIAISGYRPTAAGPRGVQADTGLAGFSDAAPEKRGEFLLAPGVDIPTIHSRRFERDTSIHLSSGACAFAAGVAALYLEAYPGESLDSLLRQMNSDARGIPDGAGKGDWPAIQFPAPPA